MAKEAALPASPWCLRGRCVLAEEFFNEMGVTPVDVKDLDPDGAGKRYYDDVCEMLAAGRTGITPKDITICKTKEGLGKVLWKIA